MPRLPIKQTLIALGLALLAIIVAGIAVPGVTCCGSRIQRSRFSGVLSSLPATTVRMAMPSSGGPTVPVAFRTCFTPWQLPQPYWMNMASPRSGSPPVMAAA